MDVKVTLVDEIKKHNQAIGLSSAGTKKGRFFEIQNITNDPMVITNNTDYVL